MYVASIAHLIILGSRPRVVIWALPHPFQLVENDGPSEPETIFLS